MTDTGRSRLTPYVAEALRTSNQRIVISGAGGWLGMATLELLHAALGDATFDARVVCFGARRRELSLRGGKRIVQHPLVEINTLPRRPSFVLHLAFLTKDKADVMDDTSYRAANDALSATVREALNPIGATGVFVASSGAVYATDDPTADPALRLYGALKRDDEADFSAWADANGTAAIIARIFNVSGPYISPDKPYALLDFINSARERRPILVHAPCRVERSYVAIRELMSLIFALLLNTKHGFVRFDTGGECIELFNLAHVVGQMASVPVERAPISQPTANHYVGDAPAYAALLSKYEIAPVSLLDQVRETYDYLSGTV